jgi:flagellar hook assembly protein FlgD
LNVYNIMGQRVTTLVDGHLQEGWHTVSWDGRNSPSGMYFYRMTAGAHVATRKMVLLK